MLLNDNEQNVIRYLISISQEVAHSIMYKYLLKYYTKVNSTNDYIIATGDIPIALCAHLDTVFTDQSGCKELYYDQRKETMWCPTGAGFDDRVGLYLILKILKAGLRPHIILCCSEEKGGIGANELAKISCPFEDLRYIIELDRMGSKDCVFYDDNDPEFEKYVEQFGFNSAYGTFSDISFIAPAWNVGAVNLSVGYYNEHTRAEYLKVAEMFDTYEKVLNMLQEKNIPKFEFCAHDYHLDNYDFSVIHCDFCNKEKLEITSFKILTQNGYKMACNECIKKPEVIWCLKCGSPYISKNKSEQKKGTGICPNCKKEIK